MIKHSLESDEFECLQDVKEEKGEQQWESNKMTEKENEF